MTAATGRGAYGLRLPDLPAAADLLVPAPAGWRNWRIERRDGSDGAPEAIGADRATIRLQDSGSMTIDRRGAATTLTASPPLGDRDVVHPYLGAMAAIVNRWLGRQSFHCGGVVVHGAVWGLLGGRESGKSSLLAWLGSAGNGVVCDDLLVAADGRALAGPRCVDLRADAARALGLGASIGVVGARERWRVPLAPVPPELPLHGWIALGWGPELSVRPVAPAERLPLLVEHATIVAEPADPAGLLELAALPMVALDRPRRFQDLPHVRDRLLEAIAD